MSKFKHLSGSTDQSMAQQINELHLKTPTGLENLQTKRLFPHNSKSGHSNDYITLMAPSERYPFVSPYNPLGMLHKNLAKWLQKQLRIFGKPL